MLTNNSICVDYGGDYCPCILGETGNCIVCNQLNGGDFCDCKAGGAFCVKQELIRNNMKARKGRETIECRVIHVKKSDSFVFLRVSVPVELERELRSPGSFVFVRKDESSWYDIPISVQYDESLVGSIGMTILTRGIKTDRMRDLEVNDVVYLRGPYKNGVLGLSGLQSRQKGKCLVLARGIALLPSMSLIKYLEEQGNEVKIILDETGFHKDFLRFHLDLFELTAQSITLLDDNGELSPELMEAVEGFINDGGDLIHIGASEYVIEKITNHLKTIGKTDVCLTCCNNAKMSCGEGICGGCTSMGADRRVVHHCKEQTDVWRVKI